MKNGNHAAEVKEFARALCAAQDYPSVLNTIGEEISRTLGAENILLWIYDDVRGEFRCEATRLKTLNRALVRESCPADGGILSEVFKRDVPERLENFQAHSHSPVAEGTVLDS